MAILIGRRKLPRLSFVASALLMLVVVSGWSAAVVAQDSDLVKTFTETERRIANETYKECLQNREKFLGPLKEELQNKIRGERHVTYCKCWVANFMKFNKEEEKRGVKGVYERVKQLNKRLPVGCYKMAIGRHPD